MMDNVELRARIAVLERVAVANLATIAAVSRSAFDEIARELRNGIAKARERGAAFPDLTDVERERALAAMSATLDKLLGRVEGTQETPLSV